MRYVLNKLDNEHRGMTGERLTPEADILNVVDGRT